MNIFSQFSQANTNTQYGNDFGGGCGGVSGGGGHQYHGTNSGANHYQSGANRGFMGPPSSYSAGGGGGSLISSTNPNYYDMSDDEIRGEIMRLKSENMQKDGEVRH